MKITDEMVERAARAYNAERRKQSHMNVHVHAACLRAALEAALLGVKPTPEDDAEWEYGVEDYRKPGYMIYGDGPLPEDERIRYYGTRTHIRRRKAGPWEQVPENGDDA